MKTLDKNATQIFCRIIEAMNGNRHLKIINEPFMPLTIERIGEQIITPVGAGLPFSLCHYYEQNGDLMQDPEMCFVVVDHRQQDQALQQASIYPYMFRQANLGIYEESIIIENDRLSKRYEKMQAEHALFANQWLKNIKGQGFLKSTSNAGTI